ncbi:MAG: NTP transferase domain-containing protein, partial [Rhodospirillales bacterium]|nr:NTP transferase domain-containing protein [Rhodospirillales bacterium]
MTADAAGTPPGRVDALVVAAGRGERAGVGQPKQFRVVQGRPIVRWAVEAFIRHPQVERVTTVVAPGQATAAAAALSGVEVRILDRGGATRQESVAGGGGGGGGGRPPPPPPPPPPTPPPPPPP